MKMTNAEWNEASDYLEVKEAGRFVEHNGRQAIVEDMVGGRYLLIDEHGRVSGLVSDTWKALHFLNTGKVYGIGK